MEIKPLAIKIVTIAAVIYLAYILQTSLFIHLKLADVVPNLLVMVTAFFGYIRGKKAGIIIGFFSGLLLDIYSGTFFGMFGLIVMTVGLLCGFSKTLLFGDDVKIPLLVIGLADIIFGIITFIAMIFLGNGYNFIYYLFNLILPEAVYTVVVSIFAYYVLNQLNTWLDRLETRSRKRFV